MFTKWQFNYDIVHYEYFMEGSNDITLESWGIIYIYIYIYNRSFWSFHIFPRQHLFILFFKCWFFFSTVFYASDSLQPIRILKTQNPNLWPLSLCFVLGPAVSPFSLYSSNLSLSSHPYSLIRSCFAHSSPISAYF